MKLKTIDDICGQPPGTFNKTIKKSKIMWKLDNLIMSARISGNIKRARHFESRYDRLEAVGFVKYSD